MNNSEKAKAAAMIRKELKANGVKGTVKCGKGESSIYVTLVDALPATEELVRQYVSDFEEGYFNGMTDCYEYNNLNPELPQVRFVFVDNDVSDERIQSAWEWAKERFADLEGAPEKYEDGWKHRTENGIPANQFFHHFVLNDKKSDFWSTLKPRISLKHI